MNCLGIDFGTTSVKAVLFDENLNQLASVTEAYLTTQLERGFSTLDFYKSLLI